MAAEDFALVDQEWKIGLRAIAVPLRNGRGDVVAALNLGVQAGPVTTGRMLREVRSRRRWRNHA